MKSLIYKNPLMSAIIINTTALIICISLISTSAIWFIFMSLSVVLTGIANRYILDNGQGINKKKKILILVSFFIMLIILLAYGSYIHNLRDIEINNRHL